MQIQRWEWNLIPLFHYFLADIVLKTKYSLQQHIYTHSSTAQFKCLFPHCNKAFKHVNTLKHHEKVHEGRNRRECPVSHEQVTRLSTHILTHTGERPHSCDLCNRSYLTKQQLNVHRASHFADGYLCENCLLKFKSMPSLYKHQRSIHAGSTFTCPGCDKTYNRRDNMVSHARRAHPDSVLVQDMMRSSRCILVPSWWVQALWELAFVAKFPNMSIFPAIVMLSNFGLSPRVVNKVLYQIPINRCLSNVPGGSVPHQHIRAESLGSSIEKWIIKFRWFVNSPSINV